MRRCLTLVAARAQPARRTSARLCTAGAATTDASSLATAAKHERPYLRARSWKPRVDAWRKDPELAAKITEVTAIDCADDLLQTPESYVTGLKMFQLLYAERVCAGEAPPPLEYGDTSQLPSFRPAFPPSLQKKTREKKTTIHTPFSKPQLLNTSTYRQLLGAALHRNRDTRYLSGRTLIRELAKIQPTRREPKKAFYFLRGLTKSTLLSQRSVYERKEYLGQFRSILKLTDEDIQYVELAASIDAGSYDDFVEAYEKLEVTTPQLISVCHSSFFYPSPCLPPLNSPSSFTILSLSLFFCTHSCWFVPV